MVWTSRGWIRIRFNDFRNGPRVHVESLVADLFQPPLVGGTRRLRVNDEEGCGVSEDGSRFRKVRAQVNESPNPVGIFFCWEPYRVIAWVGGGVDFGDTVFVEEERPGFAYLQCCGKFARKAMHEKPK